MPPLSPTLPHPAARVQTARRRAPPGTGARGKSRGRGVAAGGGRWGARPGWRRTSAVEFPIRSLPPVVECAIGSLACHLANPCHMEDAPMFYEVRTYTLRPGTVAEFEERFAKRLPLREKHSKLGAFWHTEFGPLNQVIHVYPYDDLQQ